MIDAAGGEMSGRPKDVATHKRDDRAAAATRMKQLMEDLNRWRELLRLATEQLRSLVNECKDASGKAATLLAQSRQMVKNRPKPPGLPELQPPRLTKRERDVLRQLAEGRSNKEVAATLDISVRTVETHRAKLMKKLHAHSIGALVRYAIQSRVIDV